MPIASVKRTVIAKPGDLHRRRKTSFRSASSASSAGQSHTSRPRCSTRATLPNSRRAVCSACLRANPSAISSSVRSSICSRIETARSSYRRPREKSWGSQFMRELLGPRDSQNAGNAGEHLFDAYNFLLEMAQTSIREVIDAGGATFGGNAALGFKPAFLQHPLQGRVERSLFHLEQVF